MAFLVFDLSPVIPCSEMLVLEQVPRRVDNAPAVADLLRLRHELGTRELLAEGHEDVVEVIPVRAGGRNQKTLRSVKLGQPLVGGEVFGHAVMVEPFDRLTCGQTEQSAVGQRGHVPVGCLVDVLPRLVAANLAAVARDARC